MPMKKQLRIRLILTCGLLIIVIAAMILIPRAPVVTYAVSPSDPLQLAFAPNNDRPYIVTRGGALFEPDGNAWATVPLEAPIADLYIDFGGVVYAATTAGVLRNGLGLWERVPDTPPVQEVEAMHGFVFAMGDQGVARAQQGADELATWRLLDIPKPDLPARDFVMLADHSHAILNGVPALTDDMGLTWRTLNPPATVRRLAIDGNANLLAVTADDVYRWRTIERVWQRIAPSPPGDRLDTLLPFLTDLFALVDGRVWVLSNGEWRAIAPPDAPADAYFTTMALHRRARLWLADARHQLFWFTDDLTTWVSIAFPSSP